MSGLIDGGGCLLNWYLGGFFFYKGKRRVGERGRKIGKRRNKM